MQSRGLSFCHRARLLGRLPLAGTRSGPPKVKSSTELAFGTSGLMPKPVGCLLMESLCRWVFCRRGWMGPSYFFAAWLQPF